MVKYGSVLAKLSA